MFHKHILLAKTIQIYLSLFLIRGSGMFIHLEGYRQKKEAAPESDQTPQVISGYHEPSWVQI